MTSQRLSVREMTLADVEVRINYFHDASDDHLRVMGVDRALLPSREDWYAFYEEDLALSIRDRTTYSLLWELDKQIVGFSSVSNIVFGEEAFLHLHILSPTRRQGGLGAEFVRKSAKVYFEVLELKRLFSEPNAFNIAPNRALQRAGFRYLFTHETTPSPINFPQTVTRWVLQGS
ncbi:MAG TPA: GNAT family protein [Candidatus Paceibacterota bacterium]|nr:GNAT family protein [Candidatus Paceibacterota bacterium]